MPKDNKYYRCRRIYSPLESKSEFFGMQLEQDEYYMRKSLPDDCTGLNFRFGRPDDLVDGAFVYEYFENEEDYVLAKAAYYKDEKIYKNWKEIRNFSDNYYRREEW